MVQNVLVTGATGNVGGAVVSALQSSHPETSIRVGTYRAANAERSVAEHESVNLDFQDPTSFLPAVTGCTAVFLMRPPAIANTKETLNRFIEVVRDSGISRIVFLSVAGATTKKWVPHHAVEQALRSGPRDWTILQPGFFAQNLESAYRDDIVHENRLYVPAGSGKVAFVDVRNIGGVAATILTSVSDHVGMTYTLTGPEANTFYDVADMLSEHLGRGIKYHPASIAGYMYHLVVRRKLPVTQAVVQTILHTGLRFGQAEAVNPMLEKLLSESPNSVDDYIRDYRGIWQ